MLKKRLTFAVAGVAVFLLAGFIGVSSLSHSSPVDRLQPTVAVTEQQVLGAATELVVDDDASLQRLVNRDFPLPADFSPPELVWLDGTAQQRELPSKLALRPEAASLLRELIVAAAEEQGYQLELVAGYRSYNLQQSMYRAAGGSNQRTVAPPGTSEHQTGLAADIRRQGYVCAQTSCFANQPEERWAAANAHRFGYVLRYPEGKQQITGIDYEAWHFRYVGQQLATELHQRQLTLEEYYLSQVQ